MNITKIEDSREKIIEGAIEAAEVVCSTQGVGKRTVAIYNPKHMPFPSPDGATIAMNIKLEDPIKRIGSDWLLEQALRTAKEAGDGTTTTCALVAGILKKLDLGKSRRQVVSELMEASDTAIYHIKDMVRKVETLEDLVKVATISANNDPATGKMVAELVWQVGAHGTIYVQNSDANEITSEIKKGYVLRPGLMVEHFLRGFGPSGFSYANPVVALVDDIVYDYKQLLPVYDKYTQLYVQNGQPTRNMVIFARDVTGDALNTCVATFLKGLPIVLVRVPGAYRLDVFDDLAAISGATVWSEQTGRPLSKFPRRGFEKMDAGLGELEKVSFDSEQVTCFGKEVPEYTESLLEQEWEGEREELRKERYSKLKNGVGYIHIGGNANSQITNMGQLIDDAQSASFNALRHGYLPGGGVTLLEISEKLPDTYGASLLKSAIWQSFENMLRNSDYEDNIATYYKQGCVFNMRTGEFEDAATTEVFDAAKAVECSVRNAVAVACEIIKTGKSIVWEQK